jgi:hypothetical protein
MADRRHKDLELLMLEEITERRFGNWSMAHVDLSDLDPMVQMKHPEFDPYSATGRHVMLLFEELLASGARINTPTF